MAAVASGLAGAILALSAAPPGAGHARERAHRPWFSVVIAAMAARQWRAGSRERLAEPLLGTAVAPLSP